MSGLQEYADALRTVADGRRARRLRRLARWLTKVARNADRLADAIDGNHHA